jgi:cytochrome b
MEARMDQQQVEIRVWDPVVRIGHWTLAAAFVIAYFTAEELEDVHVAAGYWVGGYVIARIVWGFIGSRYARFSDFVYRPGAVFGYLAGLFRGDAPRYLGHNPAGGAMVIALLLALTGTVATGLLLQAQSEHEGPLAAWFEPAVTQPPGAATATLADGGYATAAKQASDGASEGDKEESESPYEEIHEIFVNITLVLIALHLLGVLASSVVHRENLPRAMLTGRKAPLGLPTPRRPQ